MTNWDNSKTENLIRAILALNNIGEAKKFFRDLMTEEEIIEFGNRFRAAQMLNNKISYIKIAQETGLSSTTIARVSKWLNNGMNGYKLILRRLQAHHHLSPSGKEVP